MNPLLSRGGYERQPCYVVACCPPNLTRLLASLPQYFVTHDESGLQVHRYGTARFDLALMSGQSVALAMETDYPWDRRVVLKVEQTDGSMWQLRLRQPPWSRDAALAGLPPIRSSAFQAVPNLCPSNRRRPYQAQ